MSSKQLSDADRAELTQKLNQRKLLKAISLGFGIRESNTFSNGAVVTQIPTSLEDAEISVCGVKGFMTDELREFDGPGGIKVEIECALVAALEIEDSPVHFHSETFEIYIILEGEGLMVLNNDIVEVARNQSGSIPDF